MLTIAAFCLTAPVSAIPPPRPAPCTEEHRLESTDLSVVCAQQRADSAFGWRIAMGGPRYKVDLLQASCHQPCVETRDKFTFSWLGNEARQIAAPSDADQFWNAGVESTANAAVLF